MFHVPHNILTTLSSIFLQDSKRDFSIVSITTKTFPKSFL